MRYKVNSRMLSYGEVELEQIHLLIISI